MFYDLVIRSYEIHSRTFVVKRCRVVAMRCNLVMRCIFRGKEIPVDIS